MHAQLVYLGTTHLVPDDDVVPVGPELVEGEDVEPGALVAGRVQRDPHGVLLQQRREALVHRQVLVRLEVQQLWGGEKKSYRRKICEEGGLGTNLAISEAPRDEHVGSKLFLSTRVTCAEGGEGGKGCYFSRPLSAALSSASFLVLLLFLSVISRMHN